MRKKAEIIKWNAEKGFGFAREGTRKTDVFVHSRAFANRSRIPLLGDMISYHVFLDPHGRPRAKAVYFVDEKPLISFPPFNKSLMSCFFFFGYFAVLSALTLQHRVNEYALPVTLMMSLFTYLVYARDKKQAKQKGWRTPERHLHILSLLGGWPGALMAQRRFSHKTSKLPFKIVFLMTVFLNLATIAYFFSDLHLFIF